MQTFGKIAILSLNAGATDQEDLSWTPDGAARNWMRAAAPGITPTRRVFPIRRKAGAIVVASTGSQCSRSSSPSQAPRPSRVAPGHLHAKASSAILASRREQRPDRTCGSRSPWSAGPTAPVAPHRRRGTRRTSLVLAGRLGPHAHVGPGHPSDGSAPLGDVVVAVAVITARRDVRFPLPANGRAGDDLVVRTTDARHWRAQRVRGRSPRFGCRLRPATLLTLTLGPAIRSTPCSPGAVALRGVAANARRCQPFAQTALSCIHERRLRL